MIIGTTIFHDGTGTTPFYSPSFPRGGLAAIFSVDTTHISGAPTLVITVEHKNEDETTWGTAGTFGSITGPGVSTKDVTSLKEEIRLAFTFSAGSAGNFFHLVISAPAWRPYN